MAMSVLKYIMELQTLLTWLPQSFLLPSLPCQNFTGSSSTIHFLLEPLGDSWNGIISFNPQWNLVSFFLQTVIFSTTW